MFRSLIGIIRYLGLIDQFLDFRVQFLGRGCAKSRPRGCIVRLYQNQGQAGYVISTLLQGTDNTCKDDVCACGHERWVRFFLQALDGSAADAVAAIDRLTELHEKSGFRRYAEKGEKMPRASFVISRRIRSPIYERRQRHWGCPSIRLRRQSSGWANAESW